MRRSRGFTLIEVLVAVAVLALTMGIFISGGSRYADGARYIHDKTLALWVARNRLVEYQLEETWPDTGRSDGRAQMGEREWEWRSEVKETPDPRLRRIDLQVFRVDPESGRVVEDGQVATLTGFISPRGDSISARPDPSAVEAIQSQQ